MVSMFAPLKQSRNYTTLSKSSVSLIKLSAITDENGDIEFVRDSSKITGSLVDTCAHKGR